MKDYSEFRLLLPPSFYAPVFRTFSVYDLKWIFEQPRMQGTSLTHAETEHISWSIVTIALTDCTTKRDQSYIDMEHFLKTSASISVLC